MLIKFSTYSELISQMVLLYLSKSRCAFLSCLCGSPQLVQIIMPPLCHFGCLRKAKSSSVPKSAHRWEWKMVLLFSRSLSPFYRLLISFLHKSIIFPASFPECGWQMSLRFYYLNIQTFRSVRWLTWIQELISLLHRLSCSKLFFHASVQPTASTKLPQNCC